MATAQMSTDIPKPSFAKVAASATKDTPPVATVRQVTAAARDRPEQSIPVTTAPVVVPPVSVNGTRSQKKAQPSVAQSSTQPNVVMPKKPDAVDGMVDGLKGLQLGTRAPNLVVNGTGPTYTERSKNVPKDGSEDSQKADSSSELGTKPPSLDGKSITSGTTFALDEKESLRPDDSASVKAAAAEDDDAFSFRGSLLAGSRMGSELAARARGIQLGDMPERRIAQTLPGTTNQGVATPQSTSSDQQANPSTGMPLASVPGSVDALNAIYRQAPDEKLLEAMASPKDRLFLLRLEAQVIEFVRDAKDPYMDLPPSNSFCRMLTHKLADYYHMTHSYEPQIGSVRIFRTPFCRVPPSLSSIGVPDSSESTPPPQLLPRKIMRRGEDGELATASASPSKATSEVGSDGKEKAANQKLSREQREEAYNKARERIFGNSEKTGESTPENGDENGVSRASSVSARDKSGAGKRGKTSKQRRDDSDSFDSRNNYAPYWGPQQQTWMPHFAPPANQQLYGPVQQPFPNPGPAAYMPQIHATPPMMMANPGYGTYNMSSYPPPQSTQVRFQPPPPVQPPPNPSIGVYGAPVPSMHQQQGWQQTFTPSPSQGPAPSNPAYAPRGVSAPPTQNVLPYAYGQLPVNANPNDPKSQHPIPGSYNRHAFNPKTQSFVPGNGMPMQPPQPPFSAPGSHHGSPQIGSPHLAYVNYQQQAAPPPYGSVGIGYGMARQGSNNSMPPYPLPPAQHPQHPPQMPQHPQHLVPAHPPHIPSKPVIPQGPGGQTFSHLPTYGNPASLPQKPNTSL